MIWYGKRLSRSIPTGPSDKIVTGTFCVALLSQELKAVSNKTIIEIALLVIVDGIGEINCKHAGCG